MKKEANMNPVRHIAAVKEDTAQQKDQRKQ